MADSPRACAPNASAWSTWTSTRRATSRSIATIRIIRTIRTRRKNVTPIQLRPLARRDAVGDRCRCDLVRCPCDGAGGRRAGRGVGRALGCGRARVVFAPALRLETARARPPACRVRGAHGFVVAVVVEEPVPVPAVAPLAAEPALVPPEAPAEPAVPAEDVEDDEVAGVVGAGGGAAGAGVTLGVATGTGQGDVGQLDHAGRVHHALTRCPADDARRRLEFGDGKLRLAMRTLLERQLRGATWTSAPVRWQAAPARRRPPRAT